MAKRYSKEVEEAMKKHFNTLSEKAQRHYAAVESMKLGWGGQSYISSLFGITRNRIEFGISELEDPDLMAQIPQGKERRAGGGRKKKKK
jgi:hypothetical protein